MDSTRTQKRSGTGVGPHVLQDLPGTAEPPHRDQPAQRVKASGCTGLMNATTGSETRVR